MSTMASSDLDFDFNFPYTSIEQPCTPSPHMPAMDFTLDPSFLELDFSETSYYFSPDNLYGSSCSSNSQYQQQPQQQQQQQLASFSYPIGAASNPMHTRSSSQASMYSAVSTAESTPESACTRLSTPPRASPPIMQHGPLLLPKIRHQDQDVDSAPVHRAVRPSVKRPTQKVVRANSQAGAAASASASAAAAGGHHYHARSYTNPETLSNMAFAHMSFSRPAEDRVPSASLLCSPARFVQEQQQQAQTPTPPPQSRQHRLHHRQQQHARRSNSVDVSAIEKYGYATYRQKPLVQSTSEYTFPSAYTPRAPSPLSNGTRNASSLSAAASATPEPQLQQLQLQAQPSTTLINYLTAPNPAASLVRTISFPHRDPNIKHFWWDVRSVRSWTGFSASAIFALDGARGLLTAPVPAPVLPTPSMPARSPETEAALHGIYASYYIPKINAALALHGGGGRRQLQLSAPAPSGKTGQAGGGDHLFVATASGESYTASSMFGGKPSARVVGLVRSFDRFNTGMRVEGNIKRVEYLRGLAAIHHAMREHGCRYGFVITEIELVLVRAGTEATPYFGDLDITSVQLAATPSDCDAATDASSSSSAATTPPLTACLALWGLCQMALDHPQPGQAHWKAEIGAPAEGTRRKARPRDSWMPQPQLAEKRTAKRSRGWVWPEDAVGRKELGKRGVKYGGV
ncbi:hypothetical protein N3K66_005972 [Trichothecium roseum]|uniref:Uncharacterized protein n=1 Tax=Trichothecium roseum TaxID=47278 RepID=A0ACC0UZI0_9HYPO|nr:hypothetical protein N3K66_005972 [Trichothecium roseum]